MKNYAVLITSVDENRVVQSLLKNRGYEWETSEIPSGVMPHTKGFYLYITEDGTIRNNDLVPRKFTKMSVEDFLIDNINYIKLSPNFLYIYGNLEHGDIEHRNWLYAKLFLIQESGKKI